MPRLSENDRWRALGMLQAGTTQREVARQFNVHRNTVWNLWHRHQQTNQVRDRPRSGQPPVTTRRQDNWIRQVHLRNRFQPASTTAATIPGLRRISAQTVRRRLRRFGIVARRPARRPILTFQHRQRRLLWARQHLRWPLRQWNRVLFTDESRFVLNRADGRVRVYRRRGERYVNNCVMEADRFGGGSVMVWGGIRATHRTDLIVIAGNLNGQRYRDEVLQPTVIPFMRRHGPGMTLQQDNARPHTARVVQQFLTQNNVNVLPWPARSPDMSAIEHVWDEMDRRLRRSPNPPATLQQLQQRLQQIWNNIPQHCHARLVHSMRRRCVACINAAGGHTRY